MEVGVKEPAQKNSFDQIIYYDSLNEELGKYTPTVCNAS